MYNFRKISSPVLATKFKNIKRLKIYYVIKIKYYIILKKDMYFLIKNQKKKIRFNIKKIMIKLARCISSTEFWNKKKKRKN